MGGEKSGSANTLAYEHLCSKCVSWDGNIICQSIYMLLFSGKGAEELQWYYHQQKFLPKVFSTPSIVCTFKHILFTVLDYDTP